MSSHLQNQSLRLASFPRIIIITIISLRYFVVIVVATIIKAIATIAAIIVTAIIAAIIIFIAVKANFVAATGDAATKFHLIAEHFLSDPFRCKHAKYSGCFHPKAL